MIESKYRTTNLSCFKDTIKYASIVTKVLENKIDNWSLTSYILHKYFIKGFQIIVDEIHTQVFTLIKDR